MMKYSLKYIELDSQGKPNQVRALCEDKVAYTANLLALQSLKERNEAKYKNRRYIIVDENDKPIEAINQAPVEVLVPAPKKKAIASVLTLEEVKKRLKRCS
jgi:hypothetical protein